MAAAAPSISPDDRTITIHLRRGVRFSPPVNREVTSRDVAYAFERFFSVNVGGSYTAYFSDLIGAPDRPTDGVRPISGITTPDAHTIVFRLRRGTAATFVGALSLPGSSPVPEEYAQRFDAERPSTYNTHVVATGPYMVRNDKAGATVGYRAGRSIELVRNPNWRRSTDGRPALLDKIRIRTNASDTNIGARQVLAGKDMVMDGAPSAGIIKRLVQEQSDQGQRLPAAATGSCRSTPRSRRSTASTCARRSWPASTARPRAKPAAVRRRARWRRTSSRRGSRASRRPVG